MLPQFVRPLDMAKEDFEIGIWLILWGMFKKVVLADNLAPMAELAFEHSVPRAATVALGVMAFGLQVYCDFSGYSDIARGLARLLGFELMVNFNLPYFGKSLREFWGRWHISLSTWFRDYLYIPLGGNRRGEVCTYLNLGLTMLLCGVWHGAALSFLLWGLWHGLGLICNRWWIRHRPRSAELPAWAGWLLTMLFVFYGWMLFRAKSLDQILQMTRALSDFSLPSWWLPFIANFSVIILLLAAMECWQWHAGDLSAPAAMTRWMRATLQAAMLLTIAAFWQTEASPFIYFQF
jgi:alginate O-acetyltransferase complex protein AlgI